MQHNKRKHKPHSGRGSKPARSIRPRLHYRCNGRYTLSDPDCRARRPCRPFRRELQLAGRELNLGDCIITVYLRKPKCTPVQVERKVRVKIKPVTVTMLSITLDYADVEYTKWVAQTAYMQAGVLLTRGLKRGQDGL